MSTAALTVREVAELANVHVRTVTKALEEKIIELPDGGKRLRGALLLLPVAAVPYAAVVERLGVSLSKETKRKLIRTFSRRKTPAMTVDPVEIAPALMVDVGKLVGGDLGARVEHYVSARDRAIERNPDVLGGTPTVRNTRISVHALFGRIEDGDSVEDILDDYPDLERETVEMAITYAKAHPLRGRPGGRPWLKAS